MLNTGDTLLLQNIAHAIENEMHLGPVYWNPKDRQLTIESDADDMPSIVIQFGGDGGYFRKVGRFLILYRGGPETFSENARNRLAAVLQLVSSYEEGGRPVLELENPPACFCAVADENKEQPIDSIPDSVRDILAEYGLRRSDSFLAVTRQKWQGRAQGQGGDSTEVVLRVEKACQMKCRFCLEQPDTPALAEGHIVRIIESLCGFYPGVHLSLSGGEPTLNPAFFRLLDAAARQPFEGIVVQTNAARFDDPSFVAKLPRIPNLGFMVSFHAASESVFDYLTHTKGLYPRVINGIENLLAAGFPVRTNYVVNAVNINEMCAFVELMDSIRKRAGARGSRLNPVLMFSTTSYFPGIDDRADLLVRYTDVVRAFDAARDAARAVDLQMVDLINSGFCNIPMCFGNRDGVAESLVEFSTASSTYYVPESELDAPDEIDHAWFKRESCRSCIYDGNCPGFIRPYFLRFGVSEQNPIRRPE